MATTSGTASPERGAARLGWGRWPYGLAFGVVLGWLFSPVVIWGEVYAFRDAYHFYYPLWTWIDQLSGWDRWWPQWNPFDRHGVAIDAEPTTLVFYPWRWIMHLPFVDVGRGMGLLLLLHFWIGYCGVCGVARRHGLTRRTGQWAAAAYMLSGPVFFQIYNPIYLIGAAWVPWSWWSMMCCLDGRGWERRKGMVGLGVVWGMMILGGDPQGVVHAGMLYGVIGLGWIFGGWWGKKGRWEAGVRELGRRCRYWLVGGVGAAILGLLLSLVQVVSTLGRVVACTRGVETGEVMEYSVAPWHWLTCWVPMGMGSFLPEHGRWSEAIGGEPRMWVPSLHFGVLLLLGLGWAYGGVGRRGRVWLVMMTMVAMLGAMGPWGGLQSVLVEWVPGYRWFRYPAKWLPYAMLGLSLLGAMGLRHRLRMAGSIGTSVRAWWVVGGGSLVLWLVWLGMRLGLGVEWFETMCGGVEADPMLGRLDAQAARGWIGVGCLLGSCGGWLFLLVGWLPLGWRMRVVGWWILVELGGLAWWQTVTIPSEVIGVGVKGGNAGWVAGNPIEELAYGQAESHFGKLHLLVPEGNGEAMLTLQTEVDALGGGTSPLVSREYPDVSWTGAGWRLQGRWERLTRLEFEVETRERVALETRMAGSGWRVRGGGGMVLWRMDRGLGVLEVEAGRHALALEYVGQERVWGWVWLVSWVLVLGGVLRNCRWGVVSGKLWHR